MLQITIEQMEMPVRNLTVFILPDVGGMVTRSVSPDTSGYHSGDMVMLTAKAAEGWVFDHWDTFDLAVIEAGGTTLSFTMPDYDVVINVFFTKLEP